METVLGGRRSSQCPDVLVIKFRLVFARDRSSRSSSLQVVVVRMSGSWCVMSVATEIRMRKLVKSQKLDIKGKFWR